MRHVAHWHRYAKGGKLVRMAPECIYDMTYNADETGRIQRILTCSMEESNLGNLNCTSGNSAVLAGKM